MEKTRNQELGLIIDLLVKVRESITTMQHPTVAIEAALVPVNKAIEILDDAIEMQKD